MPYLPELRAVVGTRPLHSVGASAIVQDETDRVLLQRRGDDGLWGLPGGGLEPGETFESAARRELNEETGLDTPLTFWQAVSGPQLYHRYPNGDQVYFVGGLCRGRLDAAALAHAAPDDSGETLDLRWFTLGDLPPISANVNRLTLGLLRQEVGLPMLLLETSPPAPVGDHLRELRALVGPRPLFSPGAQVRLSDAAGRVLLLRCPRSGVWTLPGGGLRLGETFEACARRELREAAGLTVGGPDVAALTPLSLFIGPDYRWISPHGDVVDNVCQLYAAEYDGGPLCRGPEAVGEARWFALGELPPEEELSGRLIVHALRR